MGLRYLGTEDNDNTGGGRSAGGRLESSKRRWSAIAVCEGLGGIGAAYQETFFLIPQPCSQRYLHAEGFSKPAWATQLGGPSWLCGSQSLPPTDGH